MSARTIYLSANMSTDRPPFSDRDIPSTIATGEKSATKGTSKPKAAKEVEKAGRIPPAARSKSGSAQETAGKENDPKSTPQTRTTWPMATTTTAGKSLPKSHLERTASKVEARLAVEANTASGVAGSQSRIPPALSNSGVHTLGAAPLDSLKHSKHIPKSLKTSSSAHPSGINSITGGLISLSSSASNPPPPSQGTTSNSKSKTTIPHQDRPEPSTTAAAHQVLDSDSENDNTDEKQDSDYDMDDSFTDLTASQRATMTLDEIEAHQRTEEFGMILSTFGFQAPKSTAGSLGRTLSRNGSTVSMEKVWKKDGLTKRRRIEVSWDTIFCAVALYFLATIEIY